MENQTEISNSTFGFCFFLRHSKTLHCYTHKHIIRYRVALRYGWEIWSFLLLLYATSQKNRMQSLPYTIQRCIRIYRTMCVREFTTYFMKRVSGRVHTTAWRKLRISLCFYAMPLCAHQVRRHTTKKWYFLLCDDEGSSGKRDDSVRLFLSVYHQVNKTGQSCARDD